MTEIKFGFCLPIFAWPSAGLFRTPSFEQLDVQRCMQLGVLAEQLGYHSLWAADHVMLGKDEAILEGWTTLAAVAGMTKRVQLGIIHYNHVFRHPSMTAKMIATLDQISGGRMIHFVDFGNNQREFLAYGLHDLQGDIDTARKQRIAEMIEGLDLTLALWSADAPITVNGPTYHVKDAVCTPKPLQQPRPAIWMGEVWPGIVEATVKYADAWNTVPVPVAELKRRLALLEAECNVQGRDFATLEKTLEIQVLVAPTLDGLREKLKRMLALVPVAQTPVAQTPVAQTPAGGTPNPQVIAFANGETDELPEELRTTWLAGTPEQVIARVQECVELGFTHFMLWFVDAPDDSGLRLFAEQVMPKINTAVKA